MATYSNMAACYLKLSKAEKALQMCQKLLTSDPTHIKGLYRKGEALFLLKRLDDSEHTLHQVAKLAPRDAGIRSLLLKVRDEIKLKDKASEAELKAKLSF